MECLQLSCRCIFAGALMAALLLAVSRSCEASGVDVPVALHGTEQWAGVVAKAMTWGGKDQAQSLQAFQSRAMSALQHKVTMMPAMHMLTVRTPMQSYLGTLHSIFPIEWHSNVVEVFLRQHAV